MGLVVVVGPGAGPGLDLRVSGQAGARLPHRGAAEHRDTQSGGRCPTSQTPVRPLNKTKKTLHSPLTMLVGQTQEAASGLRTSKKTVVAIQLFTPSLSVKINSAKSSYFPQSGARRAATL